LKFKKINEKETENIEKKEKIKESAPRPNLSLVSPFLKPAPTHSMLFFSLLLWHFHVGPAARAHRVQTDGGWLSPRPLTAGPRRQNLSPPRSDSNRSCSRRPRLAAELAGRCTEPRLIRRTSPVGLHRSTIKLSPLPRIRIIGASFMTSLSIELLEIGQGPLRAC
jgi:hypothetical protein